MAGNRCSRVKSPVRENRAPGFVWGLSGDWQSYRGVRLTIPILSGPVLTSQKRGLRTKREV
jgi:hypothetical protein